MPKSKISRSHSTNKKISLVLNAISDSLEHSISFNTLSKKYNIDPSHLDIIFEFLSLFNVIEKKQEGSSVLIKPVNDISSYFIKSLSMYFASKLPIVATWDHPYRSGELNIAEFMNYGNQILYSIEKRRVSLEKKPEPTFFVKVALIIITAQTEPDQEVRILMQYNIKRFAFQLIGGYQDKEDLSDDDTIFRHLKKELPLNELDKTNTTIKRLSNTIVSRNVSIKTGAYTEYNLDVYHLRIDKKNLILQNGDRWFTINEILSGNTSDGYPIKFPTQDLKTLKDREEFIEIVKSLPLSINHLQKNEIHQTGLHKKSFIIKNSEKHIDENNLKDESEHIEYKLSIRWDHRTGTFNKELEFVCMKVISSFMNCRGGELIIGISDNKEVIGITNDIQTLKKKNNDGYTQHIMSLITTYLGNEFATFVEISYETVENKPICIVKVYATPKPVFVKRGELREFCIRTSNSSRSLNSEETYQYIQLHW